MSVWKYCRVETKMKKFRNPITKPTDAQDHINLIRKTLRLSDDVPISCKPQDYDRTIIEVLDIDTDLTTQQTSALLELYPELTGKEI